MKNRIKIISIAFLLPLSINALWGQAEPKKTPKTESVKLKLIARYFGDSIVLRWGFEEAWAWRPIDKVGFIVERVELDEKNTPLSSAYQKVGTVNSWSLDVFKNNAPRTDSMAMVAAQCLHGKSFAMSNNGQAADLDLNTAAQMAENRFRFAQIAADLSPIAAQGLGWRWADNNVKPNRKYIYRLHTPLVGTFFKADTTGYIVPTNEITPLAPPQYFEVENGDRTANLTWTHTPLFTAYLIEKSTDGKTFFPAVSAPYIAFADEKHFTVQFRDSLATNYKSILYRVRGLSPFGDKSDWSTPQTMMGRDLTPPSVPTISKGEIDTATRKVTLEWALENVPDVQGFDVVFAPDLEKPFAKINASLLPKTARQFQTVLDKKYSQGYYKIIAIDTARNQSESYFQYLFLHDLTPPAQPIGLLGKIDTNGNVRLTWQKPLETDVRGYTIQFANATYHTFTPTSKGLIADTTFSEKIELRTLTENIYYRIAAVDRNHNVSPFSAVLSLKKPDKVRPVAPNFKDYLVSDSTIFIAWHPSTSTDAVKQRLYRRLAKNTEGPKMIAEMDNKTDKFTDKPPTTDLYHYTVEAEDDDGLRSIDGDTLTLKLIDNKKLSASPKLSATFDEKNKTINLKWQFNGTNKLRYALYRAISDAPLEQIKTFEGQILTFTDSKIKAGTTYRYAIKVMDNENRESNLSDAVSVGVR